MRSPDEILGLYHTRKDRLAQTHSTLRQIRAGILGEIDVPLPELDKNERPAVANLMLVGVTQTAGRIASTMPDPFYPSTRPGIDMRDDFARLRRSRMLDFYDKNNLKAQMRRRAHHYLTYAASPVVVAPNPRYMEGDTDLSPVLWETRDTLTTYPADMPIGQVVPDNVVFAYTRSYQWIENRYGSGALNELSAANRSPDQQVTILEYIDADQRSCYAVSDTSDAKEPDRAPLYGIVGNSAPSSRPPGRPIVSLYDLPNRTGRPLCVIAGLIGLERPQSMYEGLVGLFQTQSKLMALEVIGMMRSIWPETWLENDASGQGAQIVQQADPMAGVIGEVTGGKIVSFGPQPAQFGVNIVDRMERAQRVQGGIPAEFGGESATNTRTDKRGNSILSNTIDFTIQAAHEAFEMSMREENRIAAAIERAYFPGKKTFFSTLGQQQYTPRDLWEDNAVCFVRYSHAGVDQGGLVVEMGQRLGIGTLSKRSAMELDPIVDDPEMEIERVRAEALEALTMQGLQPLMQNDPNYVKVIAQLDQMLREDKALNFTAAWLKLDDKYKQDQAQQQAQQPAAPDATAGQPGLAQPGGSIPPPDQNLSALGQLHQLLRHTATPLQPAGPSGGPGQLVGPQGGP